MTPICWGRRATLRRLAPLLVGVALLAACGSTPPPPPPPPDPAPSPTATATCPPSGVAIEVGEVEPAMGLRALGLRLTNCGTDLYTVNGYPAVRVLDAERKPLPVTVGNGSFLVSAPDAYDAPPKAVTLRPGESATARVLWRNTVTDSTVPATEGSYLEIAPTAAEAAQTLAVEGGIDLGTTGRLAVNAWAVRS